MKFRVTFKTPNAVEYGLLSSGAPEDGMGHLDREDEDVRACFALAKKFVQYDEYVTIEFDTSTQTATVLTAK
jgi:hypothetical protein